jgi:dTDP-6-deoxy-L-talose 4-dehydrogenase (NAD+)|tara:strand:+ start:2023 stop:2862 length:840 start_codon:yes stop_codon:yes gene_type:complete
MGRILLTGATGFVGRQILKVLESQGLETFVVARPGWQNRIEIDHTLTQVKETADLFQETHKWWCDVLQDIDTVIHSAWYAEPGEYLTAPKNLDCLIGTLQLAKAAATSSVKRFVGLGTCIEYQLSDSILTLETPLNPTTPYSAAKVAAYYSLREYLTHSEISFLWCRLFYIYGEGEDTRRLVPFLHGKLSKGEVADLSSGTQIRDFIDVIDAAKMIVAGTLSQTKGAANICSGQGQTIRKLAEKIADQYGHRNLLNFGARSDNLVDPPCIIGAPTIFKP